MNEFQIGLLLIGAVVVAGVFAYNKWQERQASRAAADAFSSSHPDVLIGEAEDSLSAAARAEDRVEPVMAQRILHAEPREPDDGADSAGSDDRIDYVVELLAEHPLASAMVVESWSGMESRFARHAILTGWNDGTWAVLPQGGMFERLRVAMQLVSRKGVVGESELLEFRSEVETLASKLGASVSSPEMRESLDAARKLDSVCAEADIQVAFHVVAMPGASFAGTKLRAAAEASGFVLDGEGRFALRDERSRELYALSDRGGARFSGPTMKDASPTALTLSMDVPRTPDALHAFDAMVRFGRHLASLMDGALVDDNDKPLDDRSVAAIGAQLKVVCEALEAHGISPGSGLALRLFS